MTASDSRRRPGSRGEPAKSVPVHALLKTIPDPELPRWECAKLASHRPLCEMEFHALRTYKTYMVVSRASGLLQQPACYANPWCGHCLKERGGPR